MCCCSCLLVWSCALANCNMDCLTEPKYSPEQMYLMLHGESILLWVSLVQGVLEPLVVLVHQEVQGSSISRGSSIPIRGPPPGYSPLPGVFHFYGAILLQEVLYQSILLSQGVFHLGLDISLSQGVSDPYMTFYNHHHHHFLLDIPSFLAWRLRAHMCLLGNILILLTWGLPIFFFQ